MASRVAPRKVPPAKTERETHNIMKHCLHLSSLTFICSKGELLFTIRTGHFWTYPVDYIAYSQIRFTGRFAGRNTSYSINLERPLTLSASFPSLCARLKDRRVKQVGALIKTSTSWNGQHRLSRVDLGHNVWKQ
jgi:hypothetical protein